MTQRDHHLSVVKILCVRVCMWMPWFFSSAIQSSKPRQTFSGQSHALRQNLFSPEDTDTNDLDYNFSVFCRINRQQISDIAIHVLVALADDVIMSHTAAVNCENMHDNYNNNNNTSNKSAY